MFGAGVPGLVGEELCTLGGVRGDAEMVRSHLRSLGNVHKTSVLHPRDDKLGILSAIVKEISVVNRLQSIIESRRQIQFVTLIIAFGGSPI